IVFVSEPEDVEANTQKLIGQMERSFVEIERRAEISAPPPTDLFLTWTELAHWLSGATMLHELGVEEGAPASATDRGARHIPCQPAVEFRGRLGEWVQEVKRARERGE